MVVLAGGPLAAPPSVQPPSAPPPPSVARSPPTAEDSAPSPYRQHRCHPRLADAVHALMALEPWRETSHRFALLGACYRSAPGEEPRDPHLLDPAAQLPKRRVVNPAAVERR